MCKTRWPNLGRNMLHIQIMSSNKDTVGLRLTLIFFVINTERYVTRTSCLKCLTSLKLVSVSETSSLLTLQHV